jgi:hypothetical protein
MIINVMTNLTFYKQLGTITLITICLTLGINQLLPIIAQHHVIAWVSILFFSLFCWVLFYLGIRTTKSQNKNLFGQLFLVATFFKMLLSILVLVIYAIATRPTDLTFVFPFLGIYIIYTTYEVVFMTKLAKLEN